MIVQRGVRTMRRGDPTGPHLAGSSSDVVADVYVSRQCPSCQRDHPQAAQRKHDGSATAEKEKYDGEDDVDPEDQPRDLTQCSGALREPGLRHHGGSMAWRRCGMRPLRRPDQVVLARGSLAKRFAETTGHAADMCGRRLACLRDHSPLLPRRGSSAHDASASGLAGAARWRDGQAAG
jgi:hypothetical protein